MSSVEVRDPRFRAVVGDDVAIEQVARLRGCDEIYLLTQDPNYFARSGYAALGRDAVPDAIRTSSEFRSQACAAAKAMVKELE